MLLQLYIPLLQLYFSLLRFYFSLLRLYFHFCDLISHNCNFISVISNDYSLLHLFLSIAALSFTIVTLYLSCEFFDNCAFISRYFFLVLYLQDPPYSATVYVSYFSMLSLVSCKKYKVISVTFFIFYSAV